jgi:hypothetical protein
MAEGSSESGSLTERRGIGVLAARRLPRERPDASGSRASPSVLPFAWSFCPVRLSTFVRKDFQDERPVLKVGL